MLVESQEVIFYSIIVLAMIAIGSQRLRRNSTFYYKILALTAIIVTSYGLTQTPSLHSKISLLPLVFLHIFSIIFYKITFTSTISDKKSKRFFYFLNSTTKSNSHSFDFKNKKIVSFLIQSNIFKNIFLWSSLGIYCIPADISFFKSFSLENFMLHFSLSCLALSLLIQIWQNIYHLLQRDELCQTTHDIIQKMLQDSDTYVLRSIKQYLEPIEHYWIEKNQPKVEVETTQTIHQSLKTTFQHIRQACKNHQHIYQLSDQLRTPLKEIVAPLEMVFHSEKNSSQTSRLVELAYQNAKNTLANIDRVMEVQEIESGKISVNLAPFSPYTEVQSAIHSIKLKAKLKQLQFQYKIDPALDENLLLISDGKKIQRLLVEVLENALRTTSKGKIELQVSITPSMVNEELPLKITVQDTGSGQIFNENHDSIPLTEELLFHKKPMQHLTIAKTLTEYLGGTCMIHFAPNVGTLVEIDFLFKKVSELAKPIIFRHSSPTEQQSVHPFIAKDEATFSPAKPYVLVIDTDPIQQHLLTSILRHLGVNTETAQDGEMAIEKIKQRQFQLILINFDIPDISRAFVSNLKKLGITLPPLIAITELNDEQKRLTCNEAGMQECFSKPITFATLKKIIDQWCHAPLSSMNQEQDSA